MTDTKYMKIEFGQIAHSEKVKTISQSTYEIVQGRMECVKMIKKETGENTFSGYKKINFSDQKIKEAYRKINKMLGGN